MKFFLESAQVEEIQYSLEMWSMDGVTTDPQLVQVTHKPFIPLITEIARLLEGTEKPVCVEVDPSHSDYRKMVEEGEHLAGISPNIVISLPATEPGYKAVSVLRERGIRSNLTLVFSTAQALQAMRMGAYFVSPFIGWDGSSPDETAAFISHLVAVRDNYGFDTRVLVSAVRNEQQIAAAANLGANIIAASLPVFQNAFDHPNTRESLRRFQSFWDQTPYRTGPEEDIRA